MDSSFFLGLIGTITGVIGLALHFLRYRSEQANINIYQPSNGPGVYFPLCNEEDRFVSPYRLAIFIRLENLSDKPNSILEFAIDLPGYKSLISHSGFEALSEYTISKTTQGTTTLSVGKNQLKPIFSLASYEAREGIVFFPFCPEIKTKFMEGTLSVKTSRKTFNTKVKLSHSQLETKQ